VPVDDIAGRAKTSHGTFYLYFASKDDLFKALPGGRAARHGDHHGRVSVVIRNDAGRQALRGWVGEFCGTYAAHAGVIRILSQANLAGRQVYGDGLRLLFQMAEAMTQGMTAAGRRAQPGGGPAGHAELTAVACLMMLERAAISLAR
jgi:AcrR family transcriptional regulator